MRVIAPSTQFGVPTAKIKRNGENEDERFELPEAAQNTTARRTNSAAAGTLSSLIAAQIKGIEEDEIREERRKRRQRVVNQGNTMLGALEDIKLALLAGTLPPAQLVNLLASVEGRSRDSDDPRLEGILDEIELRARVELAKLRQREENS